jgi:hypothetical protein
VRVHRTTGAHSFPNTLPRFFAFSLFFFFVVSFVAPTVSVVALGRTDRGIWSLHRIKVSHQSLIRGVVIVLDDRD